MAVHPEPGLNIAALARRTGIPAHTLRKWEQRYGVLSPARTAGGQRRYSELDIARVTWLRDRLADGYRIGTAAALLAETDVPPARSIGDIRTALLAAVERVDVEGTDRILDQAFALHPLLEVADDVLGPVMTEVGTRWEAGTLTVAQEHMVSAAVRGRIIRLLADRRPAVRGRAVLGCAPGERHELGLLVLGALLAADGWSVVYLGAETPVTDALAIAAQVSADVLCLSVTLAQSVAALAQELPVTRPAGPDVVIGGPPADRQLAALLGARYMGPTAGRALPALARLAA
jgi:methanogenic corrinoid protein MtbC1